MQSRTKLLADCGSRTGDQDEACLVDLVLLGFMSIVSSVLIYFVFSQIC